MKRWGLILIALISVSALAAVGLRSVREALPEAGQPVEAARVEAAAAEPPEVSSVMGAQTVSGNGVTIQITPLDLDSDTDTATFEVALNTHSVDLAYDLAELATLRLDNGVEIAAADWDGPLGGHHVSGTLTFPAPDLSGAGSMELILRDVAEVPTWTFTWQVPAA